MKTERFYVNAAIIGSLAGLLLTAVAYFAVILSVAGEAFIASFLMMSSFGIFMGLFTAYLLGEANKFLGSSKAKARR
jgi:hypothetical protein